MKLSLQRKLFVKELFKGKCTIVQVFLPGDLQTFCGEPGQRACMCFQIGLGAYVEAWVGVPGQHPLGACMGTWPLLSSTRQGDAFAE